MTTTALSEVLHRMRTHKVNHGKNTSPTLIAFADEIESALASAEPVAYCDSEDPAKVANVAMGYGGHGCTVPLVYANARTAAKVEALCSDCPSVGYPTDATRCTPCPRNSPTPASVPDGWAPTDEQYRAWCATHDMQESVSREAFDDATSLYLLESTP